MTAPVPEEGPPTGGGGNIFTRKLGPFPLWVWMGLGLAVALAWTNYSKNKKAASQAQSASGTLPTTQTASGSTPASLIPQFVNQVYNQESPPIVTVNNNQTTPVTVNNNENDKDKNPKPPPPSPTPGPVAPPPPRPNPAPQGQWVTVGVWTSTNAPWNSTLWGIAQHIYGNGALYPKIWAANRPGVLRPDGTMQNPADNNPNLIHPGDRVWVPT